MVVLQRRIRKTSGIINQLLARRGVNIKRHLCKLRDIQLIIVEREREEVGYGLCLIKYIVERL